MDGHARTLRDLLVWQKSHALVLAIYRLTVKFPKHEQYGLASQMQRAAVSIPANIAEGFARTSRLDKARFLNIAQGSLEELRYYLILAADLGYPVEPGVAVQAEEVGRILDSYRRKVIESSKRPTPS